MKKTIGILVCILTLLACFPRVCFGEASVDPALNEAITNVMLDVEGAGNPFTDGESKADLLTVGIDVLEIQEEDSFVEVWLVYDSATTCRQDNDVKYISHRVNAACYLKFVHREDNTYKLVSLGNPSQGLGPYADYVNRFFPDHLRKSAYERSGMATNMLDQRISDYYLQADAGNPSPSGPWRTPVPFSFDDPAYKAVRAKFPWHPAYAGVAYRMQPDEQVYVLSFTPDTSNDYGGLLTFDTSTITGDTVEHAVAQYTDGQLVYIEGQKFLE